MANSAAFGFKVQNIKLIKINQNTISMKIRCNKFDCGAQLLIPNYFSAFCIKKNYLLFDAGLGLVFRIDAL